MKLSTRSAFARNVALEELLGELNGLLAGAEMQVLQRYREPRYPLVLVVGCPRSGTTLLMQWLAATGVFAYPTNLMARFYQAPYIGARIQQLLADPRYAFRDELTGLERQTLDFHSELGKTQGLMSPNEFWYFWRRFFPYGDIQRLGKRALQGIDTATLKAELAALTEAFRKPFAAKAMMFNWNLPYLAEVLDRAVFIYLRRDPFFNAQSLLKARMKYYRDRNEWYSFKPPEYKQLQFGDPYYQVAGQVHYTNAAVMKGLSDIHPDRWIGIDYETFCRYPYGLWEDLKRALARMDYNLDRDYMGPEAFPIHNFVELPRDEARQLVAAYHTQFGIDIAPSEEQRHTENV